MNLSLIAKGVLSWDAAERRTDRYGVFYLTSKTFNDEVGCADPFTHAEKFVNARVRLVAKSIEKRPSGHVGDLTHKIKPKPLRKGRKLEIGIGTLCTELNYDGEPSLKLVPEDGRREFWIDPRILYQLHDQTVEIYAEVTDAPAQPPFEPRRVGVEEAVMVDNSSFQVKTKSTGPVRVGPEPTVTRLGGGLIFIKTAPLRAGASYPIRH